jgi:hypothetical protein
LRIHGLIYRLDNGILHDLGLTLDRMGQIPEEFWIYDFKREEPLEAKGIFVKNSKF